jgi:hypothetical protein
VSSNRLVRARGSIACTGEGAQAVELVVCVQFKRSDGTIGTVRPCGYGYWAVVGMTVYKSSAASCTRRSYRTKVISFKYLHGTRYGLTKLSTWRWNPCGI